MSDNNSYNDRTIAVDSLQQQEVRGVGLNTIILNENENDDSSVYNSEFHESPNKNKIVIESTTSPEKSFETEEASDKRITSHCNDRQKRQRLLLYNTTSSLLPLHPYISSYTTTSSKSMEDVTGTMNDTIMPFFEENDENDPHYGGDELHKNGYIRKFWTNAHTLSCTRRKSLHASSRTVQDDFYTINDGCKSLCVTRSLLSSSSRRYFVIDDDYCSSMSASNADLNSRWEQHDTVDLIVIRESSGGSRTAAVSVVAMFTSPLKERVKGKSSSSESNNRSKWHHAACYAGRVFRCRLENVNVATAATSAENASDADRTDTSTNGTFLGKTRGVLVNTVSYAGKGVVSSVGGLLSSLLVKLDLADDPLETEALYEHENISEMNDVENDVEFLNHEGAKNYGDDDISYGLSSVSSARKATNNYLTTHNVDADEIISVPLVLECCQMIVDHAKKRIAHGDDENNDAVAIDSAALGGTITTSMVLLNRNGIDSNSFQYFCNEAGRHYSYLLSNTSDKPQTQHSTYYNDSTTTNEQYNDYLSLSDMAGMVLANITENDTIFLLQTLLSSQYALSSVDGNVIALQNNYITSSHPTSEKTGSSLNKFIPEVDLAIHQLTETRDKIETRMKRLASMANHAQKSAVQSKQAKNNKLAIHHMRRRNNAQNELDRCGDTLLNLEACLTSIQRSVVDKTILESYELCRDALRVTRKEGMDVERVDGVMEELSEEMGYLATVDASFASLNCDTSSSIDQKDLEKELAELEQEIIDDCNNTSDGKEQQQICASDDTKRNKAGTSSLMKKAATTAVTAENSLPASHEKTNDVELEETTSNINSNTEKLPQAPTAVILTE